MAKRCTPVSTHQSHGMQVSLVSCVFYVSTSYLARFSPEFCSNFSSDLGDEQSLVLKVVLTLTECPVSCNQLLNDEQSIVLDLCTSCLILEHHAATSKALGILTKLVVYCYTEQIPPPISYVNQIDLHIESLIYVSMVDLNLEKELKQYLKCGVNLSEHNQEFRDHFLDIVGSLLTDNFSKHI